MKSDNFFYIYNPYKANHFIQNGVIPIEIGRGQKGEVYFKYKKTEESSILNEQWNQIIAGN